MPESFLIQLQASGVFPCKFCEIPKSTYSYRTPPVAASRFRLVSKGPEAVA